MFCSKHEISDIYDLDETIMELLWYSYQFKDSDLMIKSWVTKKINQIQRIGDEKWFKWISRSVRTTILLRVLFWL